jgi:hypothetical protein
LSASSEQWNMTASGSGIFCDGVTSDRRQVAAGIGGDAIELAGPDRPVLARRHFADISSAATSAGVLRIGVANAKTARLEVRGQALATALLARASPADRTNLSDRATRAKAVGSGLAAIAMLVGGVIWRVPLLADGIMAYLPVALEQRPGAALEMQVRHMPDTSGGRKPFECGSGGCRRAAAARAAFGRKAVAQRLLLDHLQAHQSADAIASIGQPPQMTALPTPPEREALRSFCTEG